MKKWVDYSSKYGLGYLLSNSSTGVFFNDSTKIVLDINGTNVEYICKQRQGAEKKDVRAYYTLSNYPKDLQKKITLLQHFRSYLEGDHLKNGGKPVQVVQSAHNIENEEPKVVEDTEPGKTVGA